MVRGTKMKICQKTKIKTSVAVWGAIRTGIKLEKMFWTAEIEVYLLVSLKAPSGTQKSQKKNIIIFGYWDRADVILPTPKFWWFSVPDGFQTSNFVSKNQFSSKFSSKLIIPSYFQFLYFFVFSHFGIFPIFPIFDQIKKFN